VIILIPAFEPGPRLVELVGSLLERDADIEVLLVDDGSGPEFDAVFAAASRAGAHAVHHPRNLGKGAALKTGIREVLERWPDEDVITADADGQHTAQDIVRVADELRADAARGRSALILGCRDFRGTVPVRSRFGNAVSRGLFRIAAGWPASDTQTGLRGIPAALLPWLREVPGERFEYETEMLLRLRRSGYGPGRSPSRRCTSSGMRPVTSGRSSIRCA
jgi:glycosyltransferase involved in cell wall biosynthesis